MRKADGCAKRGKTRLKMVKMAVGGNVGSARAGMMARGAPTPVSAPPMAPPAGKPAMTGTAQGAAMSGRTMPTGKPAMTGTAQGAAMSGRAMPTTGRRMKRGGKAKK